MNKLLRRICNVMLNLKAIARMIGKMVICMLCFFASFSLHAKAITIVFWHSMAGHLGEEVRGMVNDFNQSQQDYIIKPVYKGDYVETLTSFAASFRAHQPPSIVQIFEVGTAMMLSPKGVIKPVDDLMKEQGMSLPEEDFIQSIREYYSKDGKLMGMPFNLSIPVIYYNADLLAKIGYTQLNFPKTWAAMEEMAQQIKKAGYKCTYTTAYPGWILFESYLAIHGLSLTTINPLRAAYDTPALEHHFERLKRWQQLGYFRYGGRVDEATIFFTSGVCPLFSQSSGAYNSLSFLAPFHMGVASMPLDMEATRLRHANVAGGAALWAVGGQTNEQYKGIATFFAFIAMPETQKKWHEHTGYLPIGVKGNYANILASSHQPVLQLAQKDLVDNLQITPMKHLGPQNQIREINDEVFEAMFAGLLSSKAALNESVARSNHVLQRFMRNTEGS